MAGLNPDGSAHELDLGSQWLTWGTYWDDLFPAVYGSRRDYATAKVQIERLLLFMPVDATATPAVPATALERGLADLWTRTAQAMTSQARAAFRAANEAMFEGSLWELANHIQNRVPDPVDYIEMRRKTFGSELTMSLARLRHTERVSAELYRTAAISSLENSAADHACLLNDLFSYQKEIEFEGELHNCVLVVQNFLDCDRDRALTVVQDLYTARLEQFEYIAANELPVLYDDFDLNAEAREMMAGYVEELQHWLAGILRWHDGTHRYEESELRYRPTPEIRAFGGGPTGLGTAAARLVAMHTTAAVL
jgi:germacradienol/geosmin synthase